MLVGIKYINGSYNGENIIKVVILVLLIIGIKDRIGFFIRDNASPNNTTI